MSTGGSRLRGSEFGERLARRLSVDHVLLGVVVAAWVALYLWGLGDHPIRVWDESRYAIPARNMLADGNWLDPRLQVNTHAASLDPEVRLVKPPLLYWLQGLAMAAFGVDEAAVRLPTALAALGCAGLVYHLGRRTYDRRAGVAGALGLLVFPGLLLGSHGGRAAVPDTMLALFGSLFVWLTWRGREDPRLLLPAGVAAGLAVMTKGVAAGVFVVVVLPVVATDIRSYLTRWTAAAVGATTAVALPWHLYAYLEHGDRFVRQYFVQAVLSRAQGNAGTDADAGTAAAAGSDPEPLLSFLNYPYLRNALGMFAPPYPYWLPLFAVGLLAALLLLGWRIRRDGRGAHRETLLLAWWAAAVPLTFAVVGGNKPWYLLPMYVPGAVLLGHAPAALADGSVGRLLRGAAGRLGTGGTASTGGMRRGQGDGRSDGGTRTQRAGPTSVASRRNLAAFVAACLVVSTALVGTYAAAPAEAYDFEQRSLGETIDEEVPRDATLYVALDGDVPRRSLMSLPFYADRSLERTTLGRLHRDPPGRYALVPLAEVDRFGGSARVVAEAPENRLALVEVHTGDA